MDETLTVDEPDFKLGALFIIKGLNRRADNQDGIPNGWKVGSTTRGRTAPGSPTTQQLPTVEQLQGTTTRPTTQSMEAAR